MEVIVGIRSAISRNSRGLLVLAIIVLNSNWTIILAIAPWNAWCFRDQSEWMLPASRTRNLFRDGWTACRPKCSVFIRLERDIHLWAAWEVVCNELYQLVPRRAYRYRLWIHRGVHKSVVWSVVQMEWLHLCLWTVFHLWSRHYKPITRTVNRLSFTVKNAWWNFCIIINPLVSKYFYTFWCPTGGGE